MSKSWNQIKAERLKTLNRSSEELAKIDKRNRRRHLVRQWVWNLTRIDIG